MIRTNTEFGTCGLHRNCHGSDTRIMGKCKKCGRDVSFSHGHLAPPLSKYDLVCSRCLPR
jgi:hypothetical protein